MGQVAQTLVAPVVEAADGRPGPSLGVQVDRGDSESHEPREERLLHV